MAKCEFCGAEAARKQRITHGEHQDGKLLFERSRLFDMCEACFAISTSEPATEEECRAYMQLAITGEKLLTEADEVTA